MDWFCLSFSHVKATIPRIIILAFVLSPVYARDLEGNWAAGTFDISPRARWFREQLVPDGPTKGTSCCSQADAITVEEEIRGDHYWARWDGSNGWQEVPTESILETANLNGAPTVWFYKDGQAIKIRCYAPGPKL